MAMAKFFLTIMSSLILVFPTASALNAQERSEKKSCRKVDLAAWEDVSKSMAGKELIAFASWCSSCKAKLLSTKVKPDNFVFISVFEDPQQSALALERLGLTSECIYGNELITKLSISRLPWSRELQ